MQQKSSECPHASWNLILSGWRCFICNLPKTRSSYNTILQTIHRNGHNSPVTYNVSRVSLTCSSSIRTSTFAIICCSPSNGRLSFSPVELHSHQRSRIPLLQRIWVSRCCFLSQSTHLCRLAFIPASQAFHSILGQKWRTLYLSLFGPSNQRIHLQVSRQRNLNRGICHTPIFDLTSYIHTLLDPEQSLTFQ